MDLFKKKLTQKERQINYYYSNKGQERYKSYYLNNKEKIASYSKNYRTQKKNNNEQNKKDLEKNNKKNNNLFSIKYGKFVVTFD
jgi:hypothetical protein